MIDRNILKTEKRQVQKWEDVVILELTMEQAEILQALTARMNGSTFSSVYYALTNFFRDREPTKDIAKLKDEIYVIDLFKTLGR